MVNETITSSGHTEFILAIYCTLLLSFVDQLRQFDVNNCKMLKCVSLTIR